MWKVIIDISTPSIRFGMVASYFKSLYRASCESLSPLKNYLKIIEQRDVFNRKTSEWKKINSVAPQEFASGRLFGFNLDEQSTLCKNVNM